MINSVFLSVRSIWSICWLCFVIDLDITMRQPKRATRRLTPEQIDSTGHTEADRGNERAAASICETASLEKASILHAARGKLWTNISNHSEGNTTRYPHPNLSAQPLLPLRGTSVHFWGVLFVYFHRVLLHTSTFLGGNVVFHFRLTAKRLLVTFKGLNAQKHVWKQKMHHRRFRYFQAFSAWDPPNTNVSWKEAHFPSNPLRLCHLRLFLEFLQLNFALPSYFPPPASSWPFRLCCNLLFVCRLFSWSVNLSLVFKMLSQGPRAQTDVQSTSFVWQRVQNPKYSSFTIIYDQKKQQIPTFMRLEPTNVWHFAWKMTEI